MEPVLHPMAANAAGLLLSRYEYLVNNEPENTDDIELARFLLSLVLSHLSYHGALDVLPAD